MKPPVAKKAPKVDTLHGDVRIDDYYWLREKSNTEVIDYLKAENAYTEAVSEDSREFREDLYKELLSRIKETDLSVPAKLDDYYYYSRTEKDKQYRIFCRKKGNLDAKEEVLLDQNELAAGHEYFDLGTYEVSPDHKLLAYSVDTTGAERYTLCFKNLATNELSKERISNTGRSLEWANDNETVFYTTLDDTRRPDKLHRHILGTDPSNDTLVYDEKDQSFFLGVSKTRDKKYLLMESGSRTTSEAHYLEADNPTGTFKLIRPREQEIEYYVEHHGTRFLILTNDRAKNFRLMEVPVADPRKQNWQEVIPHRDLVRISGFRVLRDHLIVFERENGLQKIRVTSFINNETHYIGFPEPAYTLWRGSNPDFNTNLLRFNYTSLVTPISVFDYNMDTRARELKKQYEVLGGYDPSLYESERILATTKDGTKVPISLVYRKGISRDGTAPMLLTGYGAYESSYDPTFSSNRLSLLERGFIYAIAHIRGGGEMGRFWSEQGKMLKKKNTFTDFIACAEHLVAKDYTSSSRLIISGASAGGLLMGTVTNMRPDLFNGVIADVPFVDLLNTMLDSSLPLTVIEYEDWGNPNEKKYYDYMKTYSPYDNVEARDYPNMLITTSLNDTRVSYWEAAKWVAKLRSLKTDKNLLLLKTKMEAGHAGASGRYDYLKDVAFQYAFIFRLFGISQ
jgi:oligopeptidase B